MAVAPDGAEVIVLKVEDLQDMISGLAYSEHMGDVANDLIWYAEKFFGVPRGQVRSDKYDRCVFPWDDEYEKAEEW